MIKIIKLKEDDIITKEEFKNLKKSLIFFNNKKVYLGIKKRLGNGIAEFIYRGDVQLKYNHNNNQIEFESKEYIDQNLSNIKIENNTINYVVLLKPKSDIEFRIGNLIYNIRMFKPTGMRNNTDTRFFRKYT